MRKIKKINGFLVVKFNDREKREYEGTALGEYGVIDAEVYTGNLDIDRGTIYRNVFRMAVDVDGQMGKLTGHARETMQREYDRLLRELNHLYTMNHAVKKYREAQHDRT